MIKAVTKKHRTSHGTVVTEQLNLAFCDLCGMPEHDAGTRYCDEGICWNPDDTVVAETHLTCLTGRWDRADGREGRVKRVEVHLCPTCFAKKLLPWLHRQGVKPSIWRHDAGDRPRERPGFS